MLLFQHILRRDLSRAADYITFINNGELVFSQDKDTINESYKIIKGSKEELDIAK